VSNLGEGAAPVKNLKKLVFYGGYLNWQSSDPQVQLFFLEKAFAAPTVPSFFKTAHILCKGNGLIVYIKEGSICRVIL
jgi:hypothetical protein